MNTVEPGPDIFKERQARLLGCQLAQRPNDTCHHEGTPGGCRGDHVGQKTEPRRYGCRIKEVKREEYEGHGNGDDVFYCGQSHGEEDAEPDEGRPLRSHESFEGSVKGDECFCFLHSRQTPGQHSKRNDVARNTR